MAIEENRARRKGSFGVLGVWLCVVVLLFGGSEGRAAPRLDVKNVHVKEYENKMYFPQSEEACKAYVKRHVRRVKVRGKGGKAYPRTVKGAIRWLSRARKEGSFLSQSGEILGHLQTRIDRHKKGNLFLLFGNNHNMVGHYRFFNELWSPGRDGIHLTGVTHLALEAFVADLKDRKLSRKTIRLMRLLWGSWRARKGLLNDPKRRRKLAELLVSGQQPLLDLYLHRGQRWAYRLLEVLNAFLLGRSYPPFYLRELMRTVKVARGYRDVEGRRQRLEVIASDMSLESRKRVQGYTCWVYSLREIFGLQVVLHRLKKKRNVVAFMWGSDHIRKGHFPRFLSRKHEVYSVRLQGGGSPDIWDRALLRMRLPQEMFAIVTPGAKEADLMVHFPPRGPWLVGNAMIGPISQATLVRSTRGVRLPGGPRLLGRAYSLSLGASLRMFRRPLSYCYRKGEKKALVRIEIAGSGRVVQVSLLPKRGRTGWSVRCVQRVLWRLPLPPPPEGKSLEVLFLLRYRAVGE